MPAYDPNLFTDGISHQDFAVLTQNENQPLYNRALRGQYPFGSTIKPFLALKGLDLGVITPRYRINDPGWYRIPHTKHRFRDWNYRSGGHGWIDLYRAIVVSCDNVV